MIALMTRRVAIAPPVLLCAVLCTAAPERAFVTLSPEPYTAKDPTTGIPLTVRLASFSVSTTEVTQAEYGRVTRTMPSAHKGDDLPVENVTWWDAIRYCNLRSTAEKLSPCYDLATGRRDRTCTGYRLLTDAEWTYAAGTAISAENIARHGHLGPAGTKDTAPLVEHSRTNGTRAVGGLAPNEHGLHDMYGNVWEWVEDYHDPSGAVHAALDPSGPASGAARMVRGGSWMTTGSRWARGFRSSMEPDRRSPYTGFRICRTISEAPRPAPDPAWLAQFRNAPAVVAGQTGSLSSLPGNITSSEGWRARHAELRTKWTSVLGRPSTGKPPVSVRHVATHDEPTYTGELLYLQTETDYWEKIYVMLPQQRDPRRPLPVVIVPYYDVDTPAGKSMGGRNSTPLGTRAFAYLAVQQGFAAVAIRWFGESYGENYAEAVANLKLRHPNLTGLGKWVWDSQRLLDYLATRPELDIHRVGIIGHSLGGKMTLYATAMDNRIRAAVSSEPGIGLSFSNYEDFWYLGEDIRKLDKTADHHELLALIAPRPFLLIGGDSADNDKSWFYINAARRVYDLFGKPDRIGYFNHRTGHSPTPESVQLAMEWLARFLQE